MGLLGLRIRTVVTAPPRTLSKGPFVTHPAPPFHAAAAGEHTDDLDLPKLANALVPLAAQAATAILDIYDDPTRFATEAKGDGSPLTRADLASHELLTRGLRALSPGVPVLSEEAADAPLDERLAWTTYWLVDPLDGTKEFVKRNGEFTINIALMTAHEGIARPVLGLVHVPVSGTTYLGVAGEGAWRVHHGHRTQLHAEAPRDTIRVVASRSHGNPATDAFIDGLGELGRGVERTTSGSALKLCRVAEGTAHYYPRVAPTMAWDTAAAQAVVEAAGAVIWRYGTRERFQYDARELVNPSFLVAYAPDASLPASYGASEPTEASPPTVQG